jgi:hypothetical protein
MGALDAYQDYRRLTVELRDFELPSLETEEEQRAFWINLYNALVIHAVVELDIRSSVKEIPDLFRRAAYRVGRHVFSADDIEHGILRSNRHHPHRLFRPFGPFDPRRLFVLRRLDPRIHFALVCGSRSCPNIDFYDPGRIEGQLEEATRNFVNSSEVIVLPEENKILLSEIFRWYRRDFEGGVLEFVLRHLRTGTAADYLREHLSDIRIEYLFYDWTLNR